MDPNTSWWNCGAHLGNHVHIFWKCPKIRPFWDDIFVTIFNQIISKELNFTILGVIPESLGGNDWKYILWIVLTVAIKCITIKQVDGIKIFHI